VDSMGWTEWTACTGTTGRLRLEQVDDIAGMRTHPRCWRERFFRKRTTRLASAFPGWGGRGQLPPRVDIAQRDPGDGRERLPLEVVREDRSLFPWRPGSPGPHLLGSYLSWVLRQSALVDRDCGFLLTRCVLLHRPAPLLPAPHGLLIPFQC